MNKTRYFMVFICILIGAGIISACDGIPYQLAPSPSGDEVGTRVAATMIQMQTQQAGEAAVATLTALSKVVINTATPVPSQTPIIPSTTPYPTDTLAPTATFTLVSTSTPLPTDTPVPPTPTFTPTSTFTPSPTSTITPTLLPTWTQIPSATPVPCDWAQFVTDVTIPDGTDLAAGTHFTKIWRLRNIGSCTWYPGYALVFVSGDQMSGAPEVRLSQNVYPGATVDVSVDLIAPNIPGNRIGRWMLRNASGYTFGIGSNARGSFWVNIDIIAQPELVYDFSADPCTATWRSNVSPMLVCPDLMENNALGFITFYTSPRLETGLTESVSALVTYPDPSKAGYISGRYPPFYIKNGEHFKTTVGCLYNASACNVSFYLYYSENGGPLRNLGIWTEIYDNKVTNIDLDLSMLSGRTVEFVFTVLNNGVTNDDWAFWLQPRIVR